MGSMGSTRKTSVALLLLAGAVPLTAQTAKQTDALGGERLGTVSFPVSCASASQAPFNRGIALLHDFWYEEVGPQFRGVVTSDPGCAMAHWGIAMGLFHEIWYRPDAETMKLGLAEMQKAQAIGGGTARERAYLAALAEFYQPGPAEFPARVQAYSAAMGRLYAAYPDDANAGAFYALSLLGSTDPNDASLTQNRKAMAVLTPLFAKYPDNPGVVHYIIHACDNPAMAADALTAADHYLEIAQSGPHAYHMPGHIYARLGLWQKDIRSQLGSIKAAQAAEAHGESGLADEPHSYDFLLYAYLQSGQDDRAQGVLTRMGTTLASLDMTPGMAAHHMAGMVDYYKIKLPVFYDLEMRDWQAAEVLEPPPGTPPETAILAYWARAIADGHLRRAEQAQADLARYDALVAEVKKGKRAYVVEGTDVTIQRDEMVAWAAFAKGKPTEAFNAMRAAADMQDKVGQGEVDIPAREMLADLLLESNHPREALREYEVALKLSPNRLNGLYSAGRAAEMAGEKKKAETYYQALLKDTNQGQDSKRPELALARSFVIARRVEAMRKDKSIDPRG